MRAAVMPWLVFRCLRWLLWLAAIGYFIEFAINRTNHIDWNRQLLLATEMWMFCLPLAAVFAGFLELAAREKAGLDRPDFGRDWLGRADPGTAETSLPQR
jgi:hypothetical protein